MLCCSEVRQRTVLHLEGQSSNNGERRFVRSCSSCEDGDITHMVDARLTPGLML